MKATRKETKFENLVEVMMHFSNQETCKSYLEKARWNGHVTCPTCGSDHVYILKSKFNYKCGNKECKQAIFSVTKGTIFENSPIKLQKWFAAMWLMTSHKKGISSLQLSKDLGITQKSAWFLLHRLRYAIRTRDFNKPMEGTVEADETYIGGKNKNRHASKKVENSQGRSTKDKVAVFGMIERAGRVSAMKVLTASSKDLHPHILSTVKLESKLMTDEWKAYNGLNEHFEHGRVDHGNGQYVVGDCHTNNIEAFWSLLKRGWVGVYHFWSQKHIDAYLDEYEFRHNTRSHGETQRFEHIFNYTTGRLTYNELISNV